MSEVKVKNGAARGKAKAQGKMSREQINAAIAAEVKEALRDCFAEGMVRSVVDVFERLRAKCGDEVADRLLPKGGIIPAASVGVGWDLKLSALVATQQDNKQVVDLAARIVVLERTGTFSAAIESCYCDIMRLVEDNGMSLTGLARVLTGLGRPTNARYLSAVVMRAKKSLAIAGTLARLPGIPTGVVDVRIADAVDQCAQRLAGAAALLRGTVVAPPKRAR